MLFAPLPKGGSSAASADAYQESKHYAEQGNLFHSAWCSLKYFRKMFPKVRVEMVLVKWTIISIDSYNATQYNVILPCRPGVFQPVLHVSAVGSSVWYK